MAIDNRVVEVGIIVDGKETIYKDLWIQAKGVKLSTTLMADAEVTVIGLSSETRNYILKETSPLTPIKNRVQVVVYVGRESYGASVYYRGDVFRSRATPKPNLGIVLRCITGQNNKSIAVSRGGQEITKLSEIAAWVAQDNGYRLSFEIADKNIKSYSFTGSAMQELKMLESLTRSNIFVDGDTLYIKDRDKASKGAITYEVNDSNGSLMMSTPTESGVKIKMLFHPSVTIGSVVDLDSNLNPQLSGKYVVYQCVYDITSRDESYYLEVEGTPLR